MLTSYVSNTGRKNLTMVDRANYVLMARKRGDDDKTIEQVTQRKIRTLQRYLNVSPALMERFDGNMINLSHLQCIQKIDPTIIEENLDLMIDTIREEGLNSKEFKKWLVSQGWVKKSAGRKKKPIGTVRKDRVILRGATIRQNGDKQTLRDAAALLAVARAQILNWLGDRAAAETAPGIASEVNRDAAVEDASGSQKAPEMDDT